MEIESSRRITKSEIAAIAGRILKSDSCKKDLWRLVHSENRHVGVNALWILTYLCNSEKEWMASLQNEIIDLLLSETDVSKKRMMLQILRHQEFSKEYIRTDFLDFCLSKICSECEPYAVRAYCIHIAFKMCRYYSELLGELEERLEMMSFQALSPGLASSRRATMAAIERARKINNF